MRHQGQCQRCQQDNQHGAPALPMKFWAAGHGVLANPNQRRQEVEDKDGRYKLLKKNSVQISDMIQFLFSEDSTCDFIEAAKNMLALFEPVPHEGSVWCYHQISVMSCKTCHVQTT